MDPSEATSQEMLDQLLSEGKISDDEYLRLSKAMHKQPDLPNRDEQKKTEPIIKSSPSLPWHTWVLIITIPMLGMAQCIMFAQRHAPLAALAIIPIIAVLIYGLLHRQAWASVLSLVYAVASFFTIS